MTFGKKALWFLAGFVMFFLALAAIFLAAFYVPFVYLKYGGFLLLIIFGIIHYFCKDTYKKIENFVRDSHCLYYFVRGFGAGFLLIIILFAGAMIWGATHSA